MNANIITFTGGTKKRKCKPRNLCNATSRLPLQFDFSHFSPAVTVLEPSAEAIAEHEDYQPKFDFHCMNAHFTSFFACHQKLVEVFCSEFDYKSLRSGKSNFQYERNQLCYGAEVHLIVNTMSDGLLMSTMIVRLKMTTFCVGQNLERQYTIMMPTAIIICKQGIWTF